MPTWPVTKVYEFETVQRVSLLNVPVAETSLHTFQLRFFYSFITLLMKNILRYLDSHTAPPSSIYAHTTPLGGSG